MRRRILILSLMLLAGLLIFFWYSNHNTDSNDIKGPSVTQKEAVQEAKDIHGLANVDFVEIRHLTDKEWETVVSDEAKDSTPVYYIIQGRNSKGERHIVYVNSNDLRFIFAK